MTYANPALMAVDGARRRMGSPAAVVLAVATVALGTFGGGEAYAKLAGAMSASAVLDRALLYACILAPYVAVAVAALVWERRAEVEGATSPPAAGLGGLAVGGLAFLAALALVMVAGGVRPGAGTALMPAGVVGFLAGLALTLGQCWGEEVFFRGWLQPVLCARWGPWIGLVAASIAFGLAHTVGRTLSPLALLNDALAGMMFGLLALRTGGLWAPTAAHFAWNATEMSGVGATPNPGLDALGSLADLDLVGPAWLGGGRDEMNGSVTATLALALAIAGLTVAGRAADARLRLAARPTGEA